MSEMTPETKHKVKVKISKGNGHGSAGRWWVKGETTDDVSPKQLAELRKDRHVMLVELDGQTPTEAATQAAAIASASEQAAADAARIADLGEQLAKANADLQAQVSKANAAEAARIDAEGRLADALESKTTLAKANADLQAQVADQAKKLAAAAAPKK